MSQFTKVPVGRVPSNSFNLSHDLTLTGDAGYLIPIKCVEALPGDRFKYSNKTFVRLAPMVSPVMHKMDVTTMTFFVPLRLIWENSQKFFATPQADETTPVPPYFFNETVQVGELADYLGIPTQKVYDEETGGEFTQYPTGTLPKFSALPFGAYQKCFNDWVRDENLYNNGDEVPFLLTDGANNFATYNNLRRRAWRHDYFTSNLPFAQKGDPVEIPIANFTNVPVEIESGLSSSARGKWEVSGASPPFNPGFQYAGVNNTSGSDSFVGDAGFGQDNAFTGNMLYDPNGTLVARTSDLSNAAAVTVNTLRWAEKLQVFLEKNARGGTRYTEIVRQHFDVISSDARLQRAEFLGFSVNPVVISEVLQTSNGSEDTTQLGEMGGHGISYGGSKFVNYRAEEHGFFITMLNIRPRTKYMQGLSRMWTRTTPLDYAWPTFAQLGEQETKNKELYLSGDPEYDEATFGYLPRYAEYRYESDRVAGQMRTGYAPWHMARIFKVEPALNQLFVECNPTKRIFAINAPDSHPYIMNINHDLSVRRALPKYGIPSL